MAHTPHELAEEFPDKTDLLHTLKLSNAHFTKLADEYHTVNRAIHRAETGDEPISADYEGQLRKKRMTLKDDIARILAENTVA